MNKITQEVNIEGNYRKVTTTFDNGETEVRYSWNDSKSNTVNSNGYAYNMNHKALLIAAGFIVLVAIVGISFLI